MPNAFFFFHHYYGLPVMFFQKWAQKKQQIFSDLLLVCPVVGGGYSVFILIMDGSGSTLGCRSLDYPSAETGGAVNGEHLCPFILTVDCFGWLRYPLRDYFHLLYAD